MKTSLWDKIRLRAEVKRQARENAGQGKPLSPTLDIVFKTLFGGNSNDSREALRALLSDCIHRPVADMIIRNNELLPEYLSGKTVRLDVHVGFNGGEEADIEIQAGKSDDNLKNRALFYGSRMFSGQGSKGKKYKDLKRVYQLFFLNSVLFPGSEKVPRRYTMREETEHDQLSEAMEVVIYELPKVEKYVRAYCEGKGGIKTLSPEKKWCIYIKYKGNEHLSGMIDEISRQEEGIMWAELALKKMNRDKEQWARALWREKRAMDYQDYLATAKEAIEEGRKEGREEGLEEGRKEGREEGLEKGLKQGREELWKTAKNLKAMGLSVEQIAAATGLAPKEVKRA
jgi:predicted transposase/invertase (TIGR01784 family)